MEHFIGLGVAGNFCWTFRTSRRGGGFCESGSSAAKGDFPFYVPAENLGDYQFLSTYPLSNTAINFPSDADNLQIEPEVALICEIGYQDQQVVSLTQPILRLTMTALSAVRMRIKSVKRKTGGLRLKGFRQFIFH